jgi:Protein of unknown function (DUF3237)
VTLATEFVLEARVSVATPIEIGETPYGRRRVIHITGGSFAGPRLKGTVVPGGADWQVIRPDGVTELTALYDLKADDGTFIHVTNRGLRHGPPEVMQRLLRGENVDPASYYFRTAPVFEAPAGGPHDWLNRAIFVADAVREASTVIVRVYQVL